MNTDSLNLANIALLNQQLLIDKLLKRRVITDQEHRSHKSDLTDLKNILIQTQNNQEKQAA